MAAAKGGRSGVSFHVFWTRGQAVNFFAPSDPPNSSPLLSAVCGCVSSRERVCRQQTGVSLE